MKKGDIALMDSNLVKIVQIDIEKIPITKKISTGFFVSKKVETGEFEERIKRVWWVAVGDNTGYMKSSTLSSYYEWDEMIFDARRLKHQFNLLDK